MATVNDIYRFLDRKAPFVLQMGFDNAGFLIGRGDAEVTRILVSLDITEEVAAEAAEKGAQLIVSHHPVIFHPAKQITDADPTGRTLLTLIQNGIAAICSHTNLDLANGGVNDILAERLALKACEILEPAGTDPSGEIYGLGRTGYVEDMPSVEAFALWVKKTLSANGVRYVSGGRPVHRVAVGGGACGDLWEAALAAGCDTLVTSDVKYNQFLDAGAQGLNLIDAGHYPTEQVVCPTLAGWLTEAFPELEIFLTSVHKEAFRYL